MGKPASLYDADFVGDPWARRRDRRAQGCRAGNSPRSSEALGSGLIPTAWSAHSAQTSDPSAGSHHLAAEGAYVLRYSTTSVRRRISFTIARNGSGCASSSCLRNQPDTSVVWSTTCSSALCPRQAFARLTRWSAIIRLNGLVHHERRR